MSFCFFNSLVVPNNLVSSSVDAYWQLVNEKQEMVVDQSLENSPSLKRLLQTQDEPKELNFDEWVASKSTDIIHSLKKRKVQNSESQLSGDVESQIQKTNSIVFSNNVNGFCSDAEDLLSMLKVALPFIKKLSPINAARLFLDQLRGVLHGRSKDFDVDALWPIFHELDPETVFEIDTALQKLGIHASALTLYYAGDPKGSESANQTGDVEFSSGDDRVQFTDEDLSERIPDIVANAPDKWIEILPYLEAMEENDLCDLLEELEEKRCFPWHNVQIIKASIPFLEGLAMNKIKALSQVVNSYNDDMDDSYTLQNTEISKLMAPILTGLDADALHQVIGECNYESVFVSMLPILNEYDPAKLWNLLSKSIHELFCEEKTHEEMFEFIDGKFQLKDVVKLLSIKDSEGLGPLQKPDDFIEMLPYFKQMSPKVAASFFSLLDLSPGSCFDHSYQWDNMITFFKELDADVLAEIFYVLAERELYALTPLLLSGDGIAVLEILKSKPEALVKALSMVNYEGMVVLQYSMMFRIVLPFLETLESKLLVKVLSIRGAKYGTALHSIDHLKIAHHLLAKLDLDTLEEIISIKDEKEITLRQYLYDANLAFPLLNDLLAEKLRRYVEEEGEEVEEI